MARAWVALLLTLGAARPAPAQALLPPLPPLLLELRDADGEVITEAIPGQTIVILGRNLYACPPAGPPAPGAPPSACLHGEVQVTLGGSPMLVFSSTVDRMVVAIDPFEQHGAKTLRVTITGRGEAAVGLEIVPPERAPGPPGPGPIPIALVERRIRVQFQIERFERVREAGTSRFEVSGLARTIPDGLSVAVALCLAEREIDARSRVPVRGGRFAVTFGPYDEPLPVGDYSVHMLFELARQPGARLRPFLRGLSDDEKQVYDRVLRRAFLTVRGEPAGRRWYVPERRDRDPVQAPW